MFSQLFVIVHVLLADSARHLNIAYA